MSESEWLAFEEPGERLVAVKGRVSGRKLLLFSAGCCRRIWTLLKDERSRHAVEVLERWLDGLTSEEEQKEAAGAGVHAYRDAYATLHSEGEQLARLFAAEAVYWLCAWWDDPFREVNDWKNAVCATASRAAGIVATPDRTHQDPDRDAAMLAERIVQSKLLRSIVGPLPFRAVEVPAGVLEWRDGLVRRLARVAYDERLLPSGRLDRDRVAVLADAAEEAGAGDDLLSHLREPEARVRGDWVIDLLLGLE
jgi:hypothetical protein